MKAGIAGFLRKPLAPDEIVDHIRAVLASLKYSHDAGPVAESSPLAG
jgi:DNA-binding NarL/FixJ family response regulator